MLIGETLGCAYVLCETAASMVSKDGACAHNCISKVMTRHRVAYDSGLRAELRISTTCSQAATTFWDHMPGRAWHKLADDGETSTVLTHLLSSDASCATS
jgi:hypothetical protein